MATGILSALLLPLLAAAQPLHLDSGGWGVRAGAASDPDQAMVGVHLDLGELAGDLRLVPSLELGVGDADTVQLVIPVHYHFPTGGVVQPYAGGGVLLAWIDRDVPPRRRAVDDDTDFDIAPVGVGGLIWPLQSGSDLALELQLGGGEAMGAKVMVGWTF